MKVTLHNSNPTMGGYTAGGRYTGGGDPAIPVQRSNQLSYTQYSPVAQLDP